MDVGFIQENFSGVMFASGVAIASGFALSTILIFISYGIFKAFALLNITNIR